MSAGALLGSALWGRLRLRGQSYFCRVLFFKKESKSETSGLGSIYLT